jgi:electron transfer flavoprotein alpha subunit
MIIVLVETDADGAVEVSRETVTFARSLSAAGGGVPIDAVVIGDQPCDLTALAAQLAGDGVRDVYHATGDAFSAYGGASWAAAVQSVRESTGAVVVTAAGTPRGGEVLAHVAARTGVAMAANVISFGGLSPFTVTRQVVGGSAWEEMVLDERPAVFTVAGHAVAAEAASTPGTGRLVPISPAVADADLVARVAATAEPEPDLSGSLKSARVVVGAGRGAGSADGFGDLLDLVGMLDGASLGVSRVVTSLGWRPHHEQVGQTGSRVAPDLYLACGISGAIQHWAGMSTSKTIVAINTDAEAPMVAKAHYAVIGDMHEILPAITEEIRKRKS